MFNIFRQEEILQTLGLDQQDQNLESVLEPDG